MSLEHGVYTVEYIEGIVKVTMDGAFNEYAIRNCVKELKALITAKENGAFCLLSNAIKLSGATPEAFVEIEEFNCWLNSKALVAKAIIIESEATLEIFDIRAPARKQQNIKVFTCENDASIWLQGQLRTHQI